MKELQEEMSYATHDCSSYLLSVSIMDIKNLPYVPITY